MCVVSFFSVILEASVCVCVCPEAGDVEHLRVDASGVIVFSSEIG